MYGLRDGAEVTIFNVQCYTEGGFSGSCQFRGMRGWGLKTFLEPGQARVVRWLKVCEFNLCLDCLLALAVELAGCRWLLGVQMISQLGSPKWDMLAFIRALTVMHREELKMVISVSCYFKNPFWNEVKEAYGLSIDSKCDIEDPGPRGYVRDRYHINRAPNEQLIGRMSSDGYKDYCRELKAKHELWDKLEVRNAALLGEEDLSYEMMEFVVGEDLTPKELESLRQSEDWFDRRVRKVLRAGGAEAEEMMCWLGPKTPSWG